MPSRPDTQRVLVTGAAGFIGAHLCRRLLADGHEVWGLDNFSAYYDVALKEHRWADLSRSPHFRGARADITDRDAIESAFADAKPGAVVHLAAQAGVRYSLKAPRTYLSVNIDGTFEVADACVRHGVGHLVLSSTSSAYGARETVPFRERDASAHPVSLYAATKLSAEAILHSQSHLHALPVSALRFFTVYGPEGRPDMAPYLFTDAILNGRPIKVFNRGDMARDFTFIDDLVEAILRIMAVSPGDAPVSPRDSLSPVAPFRTINIGQSTPVPLMAFIRAIEATTGTTARMNLLPMQPGDVRITHADPTLLRELTGYVPATPVEDGVARYVDWFQGYYA